eukprot:353408-Chlamydomonas_euryale.AAC.4
MQPRGQEAEWVWDAVDPEWRVGHERRAVCGQAQAMRHDGCLPELGQSAGRGLETVGYKRDLTCVYLAMLYA